MANLLDSTVSYHYDSKMYQPLRFVSIIIFHLSWIVSTALFLIWETRYVLVLALPLLGVIPYLLVNEMTRPDA